MTTYSGAGGGGGVQIHPAVAAALNTLMTAMAAEGTRIDDESLKQATVASGFRESTAREGRLYLAALRRTIERNPDTFGELTFPSSLEAMAQSELGSSGSPRHREFQRAIADAPGWNASLAGQLLRITGRFKAPRGGSTHHSGLVVDIDFPYARSQRSVRNHGMDRDRNADALRSAAGVWLHTHAPALGFDTYDSSAEIWHMEWRNWAGTSADPGTP